MSDEPSPEKPKVLQDQTFVIEEGFLYRFFRTGSIWLNKLFFGAVVLLAIYLFLGLAGQVEPACTPAEQTPGPDGDVAVTDQQCSVWLTPTSIYLGWMSIAAFILSIAFGFLGLIVGKRIIPQSTPVAEEAGHALDDEIPSRSEE